MKRKRGQKKGNAKKLPVLNTNEASSDVVNLNLADNSGLDDGDHAGIDPMMETGTTSPEVSDQPDKYASINSDGLIEKPVMKATYGRVKVKLRTSKMLEPHPISSDAPTQSDTDKSSLQVGLEKQGVVIEKMEDSANSLSNLKTAASGNSSKKAGSIKIKSSKGLNSSSINHTSNAKLVKGENSSYNKAELDAAHVVIKKVMKMEAAEPFNAPVNPIELGIPDYFDVIDTPMDFGTICSNLETGTKYMNSEDVYKDVQYIWGNCYKYNNKGDYILELMKRVKKNFSKYWSTAGLYDGHTRRASGVQSIQEEKATHSAQDKLYVKGVQSKHKGRKRQGFKRHKDNCLCAICIMMRRRREREENARIAEGQVTTGDGNLARENKQEGNDTKESPCNEDISSNMDNSLDPDTDGDSDDVEEVVKVDGSNQQCSGPQEEERENQIVIDLRGDGGGTLEQLHVGDGSGKESTPESRGQIPEDLGSGFQTNTQKQEKVTRKEEEAASVIQQKHKESLEKRRKTRAFEELLRYENPMLVEMCGTLFSDNPKSVWSGPHSLVQHQGSARYSSVHEAVATFMK